MKAEIQRLEEETITNLALNLGLPMKPIIRAAIIAGIELALTQDVTPTMLRRAQIHSEIGAYVAANWTGAYSCFEEFFDAMRVVQLAEFREKMK